MTGTLSQSANLCKLCFYLLGVGLYKARLFTLQTNSKVVNKYFFPHWSQNTWTKTHKSNIKPRAT